MQNAYAGDFNKVKPYGKSGDLKCDGYLPSTRCVFQCYGPASMKEAKVIAKIKEDFFGALEHWGDKMREWQFVHNDKDGLTAAVVQVLDDLNNAHPDIMIGEWAWPQVRSVFDRLPDQALVELFGHPPTAMTIDQLGFEELRPVVNQIAKGEADPSVVSMTPPSVSKLEKNSLDDDSAEFLRLGRRRVRLVEEYFAQHHDPTIGDKIAKALQTQYEMLVDGGWHSNEILVELQRFAGWGSAGSSNHAAAILAVITYFFDRCDIFEDPDESDALLAWALVP